MAEISLPIAESRAESLRLPGWPVKSLGEHRAIAEATRPGASEAAIMHHPAVTVGHVKRLDWQAEELG
ncbi:hypothetical protein [Streptomyces sediminimaris]|uniref:hypothetical protein n=1 Tax=Streptomyces sediminimaris TaxID=3383721 RepID=UPI00399A52FE